MTSKTTKPAYGGRTGLGNVISVAQDDTRDYSQNLTEIQRRHLVAHFRLAPEIAAVVARLHFGEVRT